MSNLTVFKQSLNSALGKTIESYLGDKEKALSFMAQATFLVQKVPKLLEVKQESLFNALVQAVELNLPVGPTGEVYILPYGNEAQFQLGYKGIVTLLYRSGVSSINSEIVYSKDKFKILNGKIIHEVDFTKSTKERGEPTGAYVIVKLKSGEEVQKYMHKDDILKFKAFSKSAGSKYSPWNSGNDPELNMWKKTVLKQIAKLLPTNETIAKAMDYDNRDSIVSDNIIQQEGIPEELLEGFTTNDNQNDKMESNKKTKEPK